MAAVRFGLACRGAVGPRRPGRTPRKLLTGKPRRALRFERNIRFFLEFLVDRGDLVMETQNGTVIFRRP